MGDASFYPLIGFQEGQMRIALGKECHYQAWEETMRPQTAEDWIAAVTEIVRLYRGTSPNPHARRIGLGEALTRMQELGIGEGDAERWLAPKARMVR
jgi:hypothetical protein